MSEQEQEKTEEQPQPEKKKKAKRPSFYDHAVKASKKEDDARILRVTAFPKEGGRPYVIDVEVEEDGSFEIGEGFTYHVSRMSVWEESGQVRAIVNEGNPQTINAYELTGDGSMSPQALHGIASNNLWTQLDELSKRKSPWKQAGTWGLFLLGVGIILLMLWQIKTLGGGLEELKDAVTNLNLGGGGGGGGGAGSGTGTGSGNTSSHQPIAPGG